MTIINPTYEIMQDHYVTNTATTDLNNNTPPSGNNPNADFMDIFSQAVLDQINMQMTQLPMVGSTDSASSSQGINPFGATGFDMSSIGLTDTTGVENALINASQSGEIGDAQIALFMMFMMMMMQTSSANNSGGISQDMTPMLQALTQMISQRGGDANALQATQLAGSFGQFSNGDRESQLQAMLDIALSQVGYHERNRDGSIGSGNFTKFGEWFGKNGQPWCAMFVSWVANEAGLLGDVVPRHASTTVGANAYMDRGLYERRSSGYQPREGDTIFFYNPSTGRFKHVGLVVAFDPETNRVFTVEGNTANRVLIRHYDLGHPRIHGFGRNGGTSFGTIPFDSTSGDGASII